MTDNNDHRTSQASLGSVVLTAIYQWSLSRPLWQRDALRRLLAQNELSDGDIVELTLICKSECGLSPSEGETPKAAPLQEAHIGFAGSAGDAVCITGIRNVCRVNALAEGESLTFGSTGITVVYGDNGSGKSGYTRILKHVCRARAAPERILPNIFRQTAPEKACAVLDYVTGGKEKSWQWQEGSDLLPSFRE